MLSYPTAANLSATTLCAAAILAATLAGCASHVQRIVPTPQVIAQVGVPVYPGAKAVVADVVKQSSGLGSSDVISVDFMTNDDLNRVQGFYATRVPKVAQKIVVPLGLMTIYQWYDKNSQKQVGFERIKGMTIIHLQSMSFALPGSRASAAASD